MSTRVRWRGLELPTKVSSDPRFKGDTYGRFMVEPFERGFGTTVGNSLRRVLLSSLEGASVSAIKIKGIEQIDRRLPRQFLPANDIDRRRRIGGRTIGPARADDDDGFVAFSSTSEHSKNISENSLFSWFFSFFAFTVVICSLEKSNTSSLYKSN